MDSESQKMTLILPLKILGGGRGIKKHGLCFWKIYKLKNLECR
jgi:hypothetical protein